ncbi:MAG: transporter substrate-binding domain-containing protein, partial [Campylobacter sp.]|nr:transporter substrate-binding domain-containing protein [Campylobacter sp.]
KKIDVKFEVQNTSFDGLIPALKTGKIDAAMSAMSATEDRRKSVDFTNSYYATENLFLRKKGSDVTDANMNSKQIGVQLGTVQEIAANAITGAKVIPSEAIASSILALKSGKIDVVLVDSSIGYGYLKQNSDLEEFLKLPDGSEGFSIAFDKDKHADLIGKIDMAIEELKKDGTFDKLLLKYDLK